MSTVHPGCLSWYILYLNTHFHTFSSSLYSLVLSFYRGYYTQVNKLQTSQTSHVVLYHHIMLIYMKYYTLVQLFSIKDLPENKQQTFKTMNYNLDNEKCNEILHISSQNIIKWNMSNIMATEPLSIRQHTCMMSCDRCQRGIQ